MEIKVTENQKGQSCKKIIVLIIFSAYIVAVLFFVVVLGDRSRFLGIAFKHFAFISPKTGFGFASIRL
jgi:hypothetical protein